MSIPSTAEDESARGASGSEGGEGAEVVRGAKDFRGEDIDYVYFKRDEYAIYASGSRVLVAYSDSREIADQQIAAISGLLPLRDHLVNLISDLSLKASKDNFRDQIAEALRLGLEKQVESAKEVIGGAVHEALEAQARAGRMVYLKWAIALSLSAALVLIWFGGYVLNTTGQNPTDVQFLLMATGAGAIGALLSIAIGIRARTVAIDGNWQANAMDAAVRVLIGVISAGVLFLFFNSGLLTNIQAGTVTFTGTAIRWQAALLVGFAAGFLERLVPDLLEKSAPPPKPEGGASSANSGGLVSPGGGHAGK